MMTRRSLLAITTAFAATAETPSFDIFLALFHDNDRQAADAAKALVVRAYMAVAAEDSRERIANRAIAFLEKQTRKSFGLRIQDWDRWIWSLPYSPHPNYAEFKGLIYSMLDVRMREFFPANVKSEIRLDQIEWGGVKVNGIPPLDHPKMQKANEAEYLRDSNVVFGIEHNGEARCYPKRILAWHEMALDTIAGLDLTIVYCTLCGTVIPYKSQGHIFGTSGLLYESSKLMFDLATKSLWPTLQGQPKVGPLTGSGAQLEIAPVVTSTWGDWRKRYPQTLVLSPDTGHRRDYSEGAAYRNYFGTQELMFEVSKRDARLKNKDEVLVIRLPGKTPLAIAVQRLKREPEFVFSHEGAELKIRGDEVYVEGQRIPAHRAFWFGWYAQFPNTRLIK